MTRSVAPTPIPTAAPVERPGDGVFESVGSGEFVVVEVLDGGGVVLPPAAPPVLLLLLLPVGVLVGPPVVAVELVSVRSKAEFTASVANGPASG